MQEDILFLTVRELSDLLARGAVTSVDLTRAYLDRAEALDVPPFELPSEPRSDHEGKLATMVTIARDHALEAAARAHAELAAGRRRGILHGIPYGVKDLLDTRGIRTTWGSGIFRDRVPDRNAAVIDRLEEAGAVMMAKMSLGEFAGGNTSSALNPWKLDRTSFGSSSGTVSAAVAGLIGFGIGTETGGSIVFPASAVGASGLRPTFGRVSRFGCMALSWSLDKIGPVGRSAEDCGHILQAIAAHDPRDNATVDRPFVFRPDPGPMRGRRLGIHRAEFELSGSETTRQVFREALDVFAQMGVEVEDVQLPLRPTGALFTTIVTVESGTNFRSLFDDGRAVGPGGRDHRVVARQDLVGLAHQLVADPLGGKVVGGGQHAAGHPPSPPVLVEREHAGGWCTSCIGALCRRSSSPAGGSPTAAIGSCSCATTSFATSRWRCSSGVCTCARRWTSSARCCGWRTTGITSSCRPRSQRSIHWARGPRWMVSAAHTSTTTRSASGAFGPTTR